MGIKKVHNICNYSDVAFITYTSSHTARVPQMAYYELEIQTKHSEHKLITTKKYYDFQDYLSILKYLNNKISKFENFNYRFWGLTNREIITF